ncbi:hypothetical protein AAIA72_02135 [Hahella sp. SMD15-11]|uniref:GGDEF domain-containing protein n=1 Tax=Thermohahella caldifontis TaxID=3142973 RepID=A0AB39UXM3_9GAMM
MKNRLRETVDHPVLRDWLNALALPVLVVVPDHPAWVNAAWARLEGHVRKQAEQALAEAEPGAQPVSVALPGAGSLVISTMESGGRVACLVTEPDKAPVTGRWTRHAFEYQLMREFQRAQRYGEQLCFAQLTLAPGADAMSVLIWLEGQLRLSDAVCLTDASNIRILLPETGPGGAEQLLRRLAERIRRTLHQDVAVSVVSCRPDQKHYSEMLRALEAEVLRGHQSGRV